MCQGIKCYSLPWTERTLFYISLKIKLIRPSRQLFSKCFDNVDQQARVQFEKKTVQKIFRHGDKAGEAFGIYPSDPYINESYYPYGLGELTNKGKQNAYMLGRKLRRIYHRIISDFYSPQSLYAASGPYSRTQASLQLVLAALYPPKGTKMEWSSRLNWQPIAYEQLTDRTFQCPRISCDRFIKSYHEFLESPEGQAVEEKYRREYDFISQNTNLTVKKSEDLFFLYFTLLSEVEWGLAPPEWTKALPPNYLENIAKDFYVSSANSPLNKRMSGGILLKKIVDEMHSQIAKNQNKSKIFLYSGHEFSITYTLNALNVYHPHIPKYSSCILLEFHKTKGKYGVMVYYLESPAQEPRLLTIPGCEEFCEFKKFVTLLKDNIATDEDECIL
ncbi:hypothetical protein RI129_000214 [Pyrocoelia pectoralis]|uniref:acid phosphatase n=1 Tax=Pyrocoelia pectoralis TaxID=417401 RepID=A0AAN7VJS0_9COLE